MSQVVIQIIATTIVLLCILSLGAFSGAFSEKSGVINIGIEGMMIIGALSYSLISSNVKGDSLNQIWIILVSGLIAGAFGMIHAVASITLRANQVISGTAINLLAASLAVFFIKTQNTDQIPIQYDKLNFAGTQGNSSVGFIFALPLFLIIVGTIILYLLMQKTRFGYWLRAAGENPNSLAAVGRNVNRVRYQAVFISGVLAGIAGSIFVQYYSSTSFSGGVLGLGFLSIAIMVFGQWKIILILISSIIFATLSTIFASNSSITAISSVPQDISLLIPYVLSLITLIAFSKSSNSPRALGKPYDKSQR